jgi:hypothetical protein
MDIRNLQKLGQEKLNANELKNDWLLASMWMYVHPGTEQQRRARHSILETMEVF